MMPGNRWWTMSEGQMTLIAHLGELRRRLLRVTVAVILGAIVCWVAYPEILDFLLRPYCQVRLNNPSDSIFGQSCELLVTDPMEPFGVRMMVAGYGGMTLAMPVILWQMWGFIAPGLYPKERRWAVPFVAIGVLLFAAGLALSFWSLPKALDFLVYIGGPDLVSIFSPVKYLGFVVKMSIAFGVAFEFPLVLVALQILGVLDNQTLRNGRRYAIVGIVALVAVITPGGDPFTLMILSVPMVLFYEGAILFGRIRNRRLRAKE